MGTDTFGSRGLTVIAIPLTAALVRVIAVAYRNNRSYGRAVVALAATCTAWSYLMLRQGTSQFLSWTELIDGQRRTLETVIASPQTFVLALPPVLLGWYWLRSRRSATTDGLVEIAAVCVGLLAFSYLFLPWLQRSWFATAGLLMPAALLLLAIRAARDLLSRLREPAGDSLVRVGLAGTFAATTVIFAGLATGTERRLAAGDTPGPFETTATIHTPEVVASYGEYQRVEGFEDKQRALANYLGLER
jgi:hypothetical protein